MPDVRLCEACGAGLPPRFGFVTMKDRRRFCVVCRSLHTGCPVTVFLPREHLCRDAPTANGFCVWHNSERARLSVAKRKPDPPLTKRPTRDVNPPEPPSRASKGVTNPTNTKETA